MPHGLGYITVTDDTPEENDVDPHLWYQIIYQCNRHAVT
jgi:hypothetical protein